VRKEEKERGQRKITNPESSRRSAKLVKYALIYQWHAYQLPLLPTAMTIKTNYAKPTDGGKRHESNRERGRGCRVYLLALGPVTRDRPLLAINLI